MLVYCTSLEEEQQSDFEVMYLQYQNLLYRVAFDILHDRYLAEENGTVASAIARLPKTYREVLLLRYAYGYSTHEIAAPLSFSHAKVSKCITRGKEK